MFNKKYYDKVVHKIDCMFEGRNCTICDPDEIVYPEPHPLSYASYEDKINPDIIYTSVKFDGNSIKYIPNNVRTREIVILAVEEAGGSLQYVQEYNNDKEVVLIAVKQWGKALKYASETLQNDRDVVLAAVKNKSRAIRYANIRFKQDEEIMRYVYYYNY